jgi:hypothetical protein
MPSGKNLNIVTLSDGYKWKYLYSISTGDQLRFLTKYWMPVLKDILVVANAKDGGIEHIKIYNGGLDYSIYANVAFTGDGTGAKIKPKTSLGVIYDFTYENVGTGYRYANAYISDPTSSGKYANIKAIINPQGGHGYDPVYELGSNYLMINVKTDYNEGYGDFPAGFTFRQLGIVKNPKATSGFVATDSTLGALNGVSLSNISGTFSQNEYIEGTLSMANAYVVSTNVVSGHGYVKYIHSFGVTTNFDTFINDKIGERQAGFADQYKPTRTINISPATVAEGKINDTFRKFLGRDATPNEIINLTNLLNKAEQKNPDISTPKLVGGSVVYTNTGGLDRDTFLENLVKKGEKQKEEQNAEKARRRTKYAKSAIYSEDEEPRLLFWNQFHKGSRQPLQPINLNVENVEGEDSKDFGMPVVWNRKLAQEEFSKTVRQAEIKKQERIKRERQLKYNQNAAEHHLNMENAEISNIVGLHLQNEPTNQTHRTPRTRRIRRSRFNQRKEYEDRHNLLGLEIIKERLNEELQNINSTNIEGKQALLNRIKYIDKLIILIEEELERKKEKYL